MKQTLAPLILGVNRGAYISFGDVPMSTGERVVTKKSLPERAWRYRSGK
jgi:hypothetical protein